MVFHFGKKKKKKKAANRRKEKRVRKSFLAMVAVLHGGFQSTSPPGIYTLVQVSLTQNTEDFQTG